MTETITVTLGSSMITLPVSIAGVEPISAALPVRVMGYDASALNAVGTAEYALLLVGVLFGSLVVGLLTLLFLRYRVG